VLVASLILFVLARGRLENAFEFYHGIHALGVALEQPRANPGNDRRAQSPGFGDHRAGERLPKNIGAGLHPDIGTTAPANSSVVFAPNAGFRQRIDHFFEVEGRPLDDSLEYLAAAGFQAQPGHHAE